MSNWKKALTLITFLVLSVFGVKTTSATTAIPKVTQQEKFSPTPSLHSSGTLLVQSCSSAESELPYAKVSTRDGDPLNVRSGPNGRIIGSIPSGWAVVTVKKDSTGKWVRVTSQYGDIDDGLVFASAPSFRSGWVSGAYLKQLGRFCEKPMSFMHTEMMGLFGRKKILINENWVQIGDRISTAIPKK